MRPPLRRWLWFLGTLAVLALLAWLVLTVLGSTRFTVDTKSQRVGAETDLGDVTCRKTLSTRFPFVRLECWSPTNP